MPKNEIAEKYWEKAIKRIKEVNAKLLDGYNVNGNALNGLKEGVVQLVWLANIRKKVLPAKSIAVGFYFDIKKKNKTEAEKKAIKKVFEDLHAKKNEIEGLFPGSQWIWHNPEDKIAANVYCYKKLDYTDEANLEECLDFHTTMMEQLYEKVYLPIVMRNQYLYATCK